LDSTDEVAGELAPRRVRGLGGGPVRADSRRRGRRFEAEDRLDLRERDLQLAQRGDQPCRLELRRRVEAIPESSSTRAGFSSPSSS
jgi:hypothetical protein